MEVSREAAVDSALQERRADVRGLEKLPSVLIQLYRKEERDEMCLKPQGL